MAFDWSSEIYMDAIENLMAFWWVCRCIIFSPGWLLQRFAFRALTENFFNILVDSRPPECMPCQRLHAKMWQCKFKRSFFGLKYIADDHENSVRPLHYNNVAFLRSGLLIALGHPHFTKSWATNQQLEFRLICDQQYQNHNLSKNSPVSWLSDLHAHVSPV